MKVIVYSENDFGFKCARSLINVYVKRGDSVRSLKLGQLGHYSDNFKAQIGGYCNNKFYSTDNIVVSKIGNKDVCLVYKLKDVYNSLINKSTEQTTLL